MAGDRYTFRKLSRPLSAKPDIISFTDNSCSPTTQISFWILGSSVCNMPCTCPVLVLYLSCACPELTRCAHSSGGFTNRYLFFNSLFSPISRFRKKSSSFSLLPLVRFACYNILVKVQICLLNCLVFHITCFYRQEPRDRLLSQRGRGILLHFQFAKIRKFLKPSKKKMHFLFRGAETWT